MTDLPTTRVEAFKAAMRGRGPLLPMRPGGYLGNEIDAAVTKMDEILGPLSNLNRARVCMNLGTEIFGDSLEARGLMLGAATQVCEHHVDAYLPKDAQDADLASVVQFLRSDVWMDEDSGAYHHFARPIIAEAAKAGGRRGLKLLLRMIKDEMRAARRRADLIQEKPEPFLGDEAPPLYSETAAPDDPIGAKVRAYLAAAKHAGDPMTREDAEIAATVWGELAGMYAGPRLEKAQGSKFHKLVSAIRERSILVPVKSQTNKLLADVPLDVLRSPLDGVAVYVIKHDWARAFDRAQDFDGGEIRLPSDLSAFELQLNGHHVIAFLVAKDGQPSLLTPFIETSAGWALVAGAHHNHGQWAYSEPIPIWGPDMAPIPLSVPAFIGAQIKAICVALEAELAETEVIRAPHKLNQKRARQGKIPLFDYHIVDLSKRKRLAPAGPEILDPDREIHHKRMHFVRGHWRHYSTRKTWIKWHLRGNPDLGYIDKEYRL